MMKTSARILITLLTTYILEPNGALGRGTSLTQFIYNTVCRFIRPRHIKESTGLHSMS